MVCVICKTRRPKRYCPGVQGEICALCCGNEREVRVTCPLDCEFLLEARRHDRRIKIAPEQVPNSDIKVSKRFLDEHAELMFFLAGLLSETALATAGTVDSDVREALDSLIKTYRTLDSGLLYDHVPANPLAANLFRTVRERVAEFQRTQASQGEFSRTRDSDVLRILVFFQLLDLHQENGRPRRRATIGALQDLHSMGPAAAARETSPLILP